MRVIKLTVAYDGTAYHGFQRQKNAPSIQKTIEEKLERILKEPVSIAGSGRTDAGVHARGQVISFPTFTRMPADRFVPALNTLLPKDITVLDAADMPIDFHARFSACWKRYVYRLELNKAYDPFLRNYAWQVHEPVDIALLRQAAELLPGKQDFAFFRSSGSIDGDSVKTIYLAQWRELKPGSLEFAVTGDGFLYHMVRNIVWNLVEVGLGHKSVETLAAEIKGRERHFKLAPAPPEGLYLDYVGYTPFFDKKC